MDTAALILDYIKALIWPLLVIGVLAAYRHQLGDLVQRTRSVSTTAVTVEFATELLDEAGSKHGEPTTAENRRGTARRLEHAARYLKDDRILWVDDYPQNNASLTKLFRKFGMNVDTALSSEEALAKLRSGSYDLLITDMGRGDDPNAGNTLLNELSLRNINLSALVFSTASRIQEGVDHRAFAATPSTDELVHYVIDLMERIKLS